MNNLTPQLTDLAIQSYYSHEEKYYNVSKYNKPMVYNNGSNFIKSYNVSDKVIDTIKKLYNPYPNAYPINPEIDQCANLIILRCYLTETITVTYLFTDPKVMNKKIKTIGARHYAIRKIFVIPEMNNAFTIKQIMRADPNSITN